MLNLWHLLISIRTNRVDRAFPGALHVAPPYYTISLRIVAITARIIYTISTTKAYVKKKACCLGLFLFYYKPIVFLLEDDGEMVIEQFKYWYHQLAHLRVGSF